MSRAGRGRAAIAAVFIAISASSCVFATRHPDPTRSPQFDAGFDCRLLESQGVNPFGAGIGDWNDDGHLDLAIGYAHGGTATFLGDSERNWKAGVFLDTGHLTRGVASGDLDRDGDLDVVVAGGDPGAAIFLANDGRGNFTVAGHPFSGIAPFHAYLADLDGNDSLDVVVPNESNNGMPRGTVGIFLNPRIDDSKTMARLLTAGTHPSAVAIAEFDGQPGLDLAVSNWGDGSLWLFGNRGDGRFDDGREIRYGGQLAYGIAAADFNGDGHSDLAITDAFAASVWILDGDAKGGFAPARRFVAGKGVRHVEVVDINADRRPDLLTANTADGTVALLLGKGDGDFAAPIAVPVGPTPRVAIAGDLDDDGRLDLVVTLLGTAQTAVLYQTDGAGEACPKVELRAD